MDWLLVPLSPRPLPAGAGRGSRVIRHSAFKVRLLTSAATGSGFSAERGQVSSFRCHVAGGRVSDASLPSRGEGKSRCHVAGGRVGDASLPSRGEGRSRCHVAGGRVGDASLPSRGEGKSRCHVAGGRVSDASLPSRGEGKSRCHVAGGRVGDASLPSRGEGVGSFDIRHSMPTGKSAILGRHQSSKVTAPAALGLLLPLNPSACLPE